VKRQPARRDNPIALSLVAMVVTGVLGWLFVLPMWRAHRSLDWTPATCTIVSTGHATHYDRHGTPSDVLRVEYAYHVDGQRYRGTRVDFSGSIDAAEQEVTARATDGDQVPCWYDPIDPREAVLVRTAWRPGLGAWFVFVLLVLLAVTMAAIARPGRGDTDSLWPIAPRVVLSAMLIAIAYFAWDGGTGAATATAFTLVAAAGVLWCVTTVRRWTAIQSQ
jgi:hypothetical protein